MSCNNHLSATANNVKLSSRCEIEWQVYYIFTIYEAVRPSIVSKNNSSSANNFDKYKYRNYRTRSYETSPYANRKFTKRSAKTQIRHQNVPLHDVCGPT